MLMKMVAVYDMKLGAFQRPFFAPTEGVAVRSFMDACSGESDFAKHPADYALYSLGTFDCEKGEFSDLEKRSLLAAADCISEEV